MAWDSNTIGPCRFFLSGNRHREGERDDRESREEESSHYITLVCVVQSSRLLGDLCHASYMPWWHKQDVRLELVARENPAHASGEAARVQSVTLTKEPPQLGWHEQG